MKRILVILLLFSFSSFCMAGYSFINDSLEGFQNLQDSIVFDAFVPISFFKTSSGSIKGIGSWYTVESLLYDDEGLGADVQGDDLKANAYSIFGSYTLSERWAVFGLYSGIRFSGESTFEYPNSMLPYQGSLDCSNSGMRVGIVGAAFECMQGDEKKNISIPIYMAVKIQFNNISMDYSDTNFDVFSIENGDVNFNLLVGGAVSVRVNKNIEITPYILVGLMNDYTYQVTRAVPFDKYTYGISKTTFLQGVEMSWKIKSSLIMSFSVDGMINKINPLSAYFLPGLEMNSISISVGYTF